jgi:hypothetical protein
MSNPQSSSADASSRGTSQGCAQAEEPEPAREGDVPDNVHFDFPLDWKAVYRRTQERELDRRVPDELQRVYR